MREAQAAVNLAALNAAQGDVAVAGMMEGKVVVVTGAGGGIGREIAIMMAAAGARVIINDVGASLTGSGASETPAQQTREVIRQGGGAAEISTDSVAEWGSAQRIIQAAIDHFGRIDAVVNNAGILRDGIFHRMSADDWLAVISVHLNGSFFVSRAAAEHYRKQESGAFVHITSTSGLIGNIGQANYAAAKLGITALSKSIALDMQRYNVRSNCLSPWAWSRMTSSIPATTPEQQAAVEKLQRMTPDKNAPLAVFLASDAAKGVSGQVFGTRMNEIYLFSSPRPIRIVHRADGWTPETIAAACDPRHCRPRSCRSTPRSRRSPGSDLTHRRSGFAGLRHGLSEYCSDIILTAVQATGMPMVAADAASGRKRRRMADDTRPRSIADMPAQVAASALPHRRKRAAASSTPATHSMCSCRRSPIRSSPRNRAGHWIRRRRPA